MKEASGVRQVKQFRRKKVKGGELEEEEGFSSRGSSMKIICNNTRMQNHKKTSHHHHHPNHHHLISTTSSTTTATMNNSKTTTTNLKIAFFAFISLLLVLLICINGVHSLNCYHCSSVDNPSCDESFTGKANITEVDCEKHIGRPAKVCRKIVQYIEEKKVVIRSCGFIDDHEEKDRKPMCYKRSGTFAIMMESCNCYTDNCNHSASLVPHQSVLILLVASCSMILLCWSKKQ